MVMKDPMKMMSNIRTRLLLDQPFFGSLAMRLQMVEDPHIPTMYTNGVEIRFNPQFVATLTDREQMGVLAHETMHCALLHIYRRGVRDPFGWNVACDYALNSVLLKSGLTLPKGCLIDPKFDGMAAEQVYSKLHFQKVGGKGSGKDQQSGQASAGAKGDGSGNGSIMGNCPSGEFTDAPKEAAEGSGADASDGMTESDWAIAAEQAARVATMAGTLPAGIDRAVKETREPRIDWRSELRRFIVNTVPSDYTWSKPNRRFAYRGLYLPGTLKENVGPMVIGVDTSGSVSSEMLAGFAAELTAILQDAKPEKLHVVYCDATVNGTQEFDPEDGVVKLEMKGGGGTAFKPVFNWVEKQGIQPVCMVYLTDLMSSDTPKEPEYQVLWVTPSWVTAVGPFGETLRIDGI